MYVGISSDVLLKVLPTPEVGPDAVPGFVELEFTVNPIGKTENIRVVESSSALLEQAALAAASGLRYRPRVEGRQAVAAEGIRYRFEF